MDCSRHGDENGRLERLATLDDKRFYRSVYQMCAHTHTQTGASNLPLLRTFHSRQASSAKTRRRLARGTRSTSCVTNSPCFIFRPDVNVHGAKFVGRTLGLTEHSSIIKFPRSSPFGELPDARMGATVEPRGGQRPTRSCSLSISLPISPRSLRMFRPKRTQSLRSCQVPRVHFADVFLGKRLFEASRRRS